MVFLEMRRVAVGGVRLGEWFTDFKVDTCPPSSASFVLPVLLIAAESRAKELGLCVDRRDNSFLGHRLHFLDSTVNVDPLYN